MTKIKLTKNEKLVLESLVESYDSYDGETGYWNFQSLMNSTKLDRRQVRLAARSLTRKGLAEFKTGLWSDDGPAGAGYGITEAGAAFISPCVSCGAYGEYEVKDKLFCEKHFKNENI